MDMAEDQAKELLRRAFTVLLDEYDQGSDSFFVVVTKEGKNPMLAVTSQTIVGELNLKSLIAFAVHAIDQYCTTTGMNPHVFIAKYLTSVFDEQDAGTLMATLEQELYVNEQDYIDAVLGEESYSDIEEDDDEGVIYVPNPDWDSVKN